MVNLFINYYRDKNPERANELMVCFLKNGLCKNIDHAFVFVDDTIPNQRDRNQLTYVYFGRPTFEDFFFYINTVTNEDDINIIANTDIYFDDENIELIKNNIGSNECYALSRWDVFGANHTFKKLFDRPDTADTWVFKGKIRNVNGCDFFLGTPGCDNAIAYKLEQAGYNVLNPSKDIKTYHLHLSGIRNYTAADRVPPPYKLIHPHHLPANIWVEKIKEIKADKMQSQFDEEGIIAFIFQNIGIEHKWFVDFGAGAYDGTMSNTRKLKQDGWFGFGVDMTPTNDPWVIKEFIKPDNACQILKNMAAPFDFDFLNLDIDSSDFYVLQNILKEYRPRLICTEFNGTLDPNISLVLEYEEGYTWDKTNKYGYSFAAGKKLLEENGYVIIYNQHDTNIFAIRKELAPAGFIEVKAKRNIYHPINQTAKWIPY